MFVANRAVPQRKPTMTEHTKTDGMPGMDLPVLPDSAALGLAKAPPRNRPQTANCRSSPETPGENTIASLGPVCYIDPQCSGCNMKV